MHQGGDLSRAGGLAALVFALAACGDAAPEHESSLVPEAPAAWETPTHVGRAACASCHAQQAAAYEGSHHDLAMDVVSDRSVVADLGAPGTADLFRRDGDRFWVSTEGPGGDREDFLLKWTLGVTPLQQYLVGLPEGRVGALTTAWDARAPEQGGQRWFSLYPEERLQAGDPLHWTGIAQRWNTMCADCHSTGFRKGLDPSTGVYASTFTEIDVSCEACHGPGSAHVASEGRAPLLLGRRPRSWLMEADGIARRAPASTSHPEVEACSRCHARRSPLVELYTHGGPLLDTHRPTVLSEGLYFLDGQIRDEVYVWGSFVQSPMYAAGVSCSDCHDPHTLKVRATGNALCVRCHDAGRYDAPTHHHHLGGALASGCTTCHMPTRTYMGVDVRSDHSFRVPRPDLAVGAPDPCTTCHDQDAAWAAAQILRWTNAPPAPHFSQARQAARVGALDAPAQLARVARTADAAIVRATALADLRALPTREALDAAIGGLGDPDPLVRREAIALLAGLVPPEQRLSPLRPLLSDPVRGVRIEAARGIEGTLAVEGAYAKALAEAEAELLLNADQPAAWIQLGLLHLGTGRVEEARAAFERAVAMAPDNVAGWANLADLSRVVGDEVAAEQWLRRGLEVLPASPELHEALGLALTRQGRDDEALEALRQAADHSRQARQPWLLALALHDRGQSEEAVSLLVATLQAHPTDRGVLRALVTVHADLGDRESALQWARVYQERAPWDPAARQFVTSLGSPPR